MIPPQRPSKSRPSFNREQRSALSNGRQVLVTRLAWCFKESGALEDLLQVCILPGKLQEHGVVKELRAAREGQATLDYDH
jgi:hypothetical protein